MKDCAKHSKKSCSLCKYYDYCDRVKVCDGVCNNCDITDCENNPNYKEKEND